MTVPFNSYVQAEQIEPGALVGQQSQIATLIGTDHFWVEVSVPVSDLEWFAIPGVSGATGASATVYLETGAGRIERQGRVIRLLNNLDPIGRMARVLVEIDDPLGLERGDERGLPLFLGAYVSVEIEGRTLTDVVEVPRRLIRDGGRVFVYADDSTLSIRNIEVLYGGADSVYVRDGLAPGSQVVSTRIGAPVEGMALRLPTDEGDDAGPAESPEGGE